jgi:hypothetical protein
MITTNVFEKNVIEPSTVFKLVVENVNYEWFDQFITGSEVRKLTNLSNESDMYLAVTEPWNDQIIGDNEKVDLGRPDVEHFYFKRNLKLIINKKNFIWHREYVTGKQIKHLGGILLHDDLFLVVEKPGEDELISDNAKVNLALPGVEHFYSVEVDKVVVIIVNGTPKKWDSRKISFKEIIEIAYGNYIDLPTMVYTVAYEDGPKQNPEGSMIKDSVVFVKNKMIFHATATDKS